MPAGPGQIIWDVAIELADQKTVGPQVEKESTILITGAKECGKSSILPMYLNQEELPKPTVALDYAFAHVGATNKMVKDIGHYWELGGGIWLVQLMEVVIKPETIQSLTLVIMVDLSKPTEIWVTIKSLLAAAKERIQAVVSQMKADKADILEQLKKKARDRFGKDHKDRDIVEPFLIPLVIIGGKYDIFQFFTIRDKSLGKRIEYLKNHHLFGNHYPKLHEVDHNKPLSVYVGHDSLQSIGHLTPGGQDSREMQNKSLVENFEFVFTKYFPQEKSADPQTAADPSQEPQFKEHDIDILKRQKDQELEQRRQRPFNTREQTVEKIYIDDF
ncbi:cytoplasmic dynein 2 light intermediate chain 1 isoform X2 [Octopus sinensis]|uniref:Cytoplasmic dynein 2 light intermediate chain 1 n=1 Tax=Octopus sinensis TaxID=2607531 RepID=A0A7E6FN18_9MOLL|nr:cytoplasmic dynein 2 light intermediate chain 1 isoform X2 [Octopus sinensis]